jgi:hypothetical protein
MFLQPQAAVTDAWNVIVSLLQSGAIKPIVAKTFPLIEAADALRYLVEGRPFGGSSSQTDRPWSEKGYGNNLEGIPYQRFVFLPNRSEIGKHSDRRTRPGFNGPTWHPIKVLDV